MILGFDCTFVGVGFVVCCLSNNSTRFHKTPHSVLEQKENLYILKKYFNKKIFLNNKILNGVHERIGPIRSFITGGCMARDESTSGIHRQNQFVESLFPLLSQTAFQERSPRVSHVLKPISPAIMV